jgi:flagellar biogenesis protein FliO
MAAALVFVIILIIAAGYLLRRKQNRFGLMSVVSYQPFGPKKGVAALKIGSEILILSVTPNDMRLLKTFKDSELDINENEGFQSKFEKFRNIGVHRN